MTYSYHVAKRALEGVVTSFSMPLVKCLHSWRQSFSNLCSPQNGERSGTLPLLDRLLGRCSYGILNLRPKDAMDGFAMPREDNRNKMNMSPTQMPSRETCPRLKENTVFKRSKSNGVGHDMEMCMAFCNVPQNFAPLQRWCNLREVEEQCCIACLEILIEIIMLNQTERI